MPVRVSGDLTFGGLIDIWWRKSKGTPFKRAKMTKNLDKPCSNEKIGSCVIRIYF